MKTLWLGAAAAALVCGSLAGCASSPHYPIDPSQPQGPAPLSVGKPRYSIDPPAAPPPAQHAAAQPDAAQQDAGRDPPPAEDEAPLSAPVKPVESQSLPPPGESANADGARLQYASLTTQSDASTATTTPPPPGGSPTSAPLPAPAPQPQPPPGADATALTPQMVIHDQPTGAPTQTPPPSHVATQTRETGTLPDAERREGGAHLAIAGDVVHASGIFENYEVQKGDHIDALARGFSTSRSTLLAANDGLKPPYVLRPGQILKVPVAKAYMAQSGDTLGGVAKRFSVSVDELAELNHLSSRSALRAGAEIGLPSSMRDRGPQRITEADYAAETAPQPQHYSYSPPPAAHRLTQVTPQPNLVIRDQGSAGYATGRPPGAPQPQATPGLSDVEIAKAAKGRFIWPIRGDVLNRFGPMGVGQRNDGIDIRAPQGSSVKAAADGKVVYAGDKIPGYGNAVLVQHADGWVTVYAYLDKLDVHNQQDVTQGQELGLSGVTSDGAKPAVHFEIRYHPSAGVKAQPVDPVLVLPIG